MKHHRIETGVAELSVAESGGGPPVLFIHGNSAAKEEFATLMAGRLAARYRFLAVDLPGHGASADARGEPMAAYTIPGYAGALIELLTTLGARDAALVGWSLGGHIAIEMMGELPSLRGLLISGTPPVPKSPEAFAVAFLPNPVMGLTGKREFTAEDAAAYGAAVYGTARPAELAALRRTDGRAREAVIGGFMGGLGRDQKETVEALTRPIAVIAGKDDPLINNDFVMKGVAYRNLVGGKVALLDGVGHAAFSRAADRVAPLLDGFLAAAFAGRS